MASPHATRLALPLFLVFATLGCGREASPSLVEVAGRVTFDGKPLTEGTVSLRPDQGGGWHQPTGPIGRDGSFVVFTEGQRGAPPGVYRVVVFANEPAATNGSAHPGLPQSIIPTIYNDPNRSPLRIEAKLDPQGGGSPAHLLELKSVP